MPYGPYSRSNPELDASYMFMRDNITLDTFFENPLNKKYCTIFHNFEMPKPDIKKEEEVIFSEFQAI